MTKLLTKKEIAEFFARLAKAMPDPKTELVYDNPYTLLVSVVLSAQATDKSVNKATAELFKVADTPKKMVALGEKKLTHYIKTIGLYRGKAKNVIALSKLLIEKHDGEVPRDREALEELPGVGRKTANVVLNVAFGEKTIAVDTHIFRVSNRTGLAPGKNPREVEDGLVKTRARRICAARPSLADPARPLHLRRAQAAVPDLYRARSLQLQQQDESGRPHETGCGAAWSDCRQLVSAAELFGCGRVSTCCTVSTPRVG